MIEYEKTEQLPAETDAERETVMIMQAAAANQGVGEHIRNLVSMYQEAGRQMLEMGRNMQETRQEMAAMAEMLRVANERMAAMEKTMRTLEKVTPQQAARVNRMIRERAGEICEEYRMSKAVSMISAGQPVYGPDGTLLGTEYKAAYAPAGTSAEAMAEAQQIIGLRGKPVQPEPDPEKLKAVAAAIRKDLRAMTGVRTAREICRCDWEAVTDFLKEWEDYDAIQRIRKGAPGRRGR